MSNDIKVSIIASSIRTHWWTCFLTSLKSNTVKYEVIFVGSVKPTFDIALYPELKHIYTTVKPAQAYEIGFRQAQGELIHWSADDAEYDPHALDYVYDSYTFKNDYKLMIALSTFENGRDWTSHHR